MGMTRFQQLNSAQILAVFLYGKAKDKSRTEKMALAMEIQEKQQSGERLREYFYSCTSHPYFPRLYDIAGDFTRYLDKDRSLAECYTVSRSLLYGNLETTHFMETTQ
ncbi:hypothetical protein SAMN04489760_1174 [Syntrophus gentianae]|uniref:Uncharacterized protein n=1 Tax=Syntrophus gentianae TaxID=43775 RepID=A0A1H7YNQ9_9BACT|nr:hypothetical protein [Syntrophus gentianae]SEM46928.1 hypothetical protein SAMN04489760_1174 [Syntrophus gentianae]